MRTIESCQAKLDAAKEAYAKAVGVINHELQHLVNVDPDNLKPAVKVQDAFGCNPEVPALIVPEQPEAAEPPKPKRARRAKK